MNKSLVLVMCDVLVLSAMSLSTGGFEGDDGSRGNDSGPVSELFNLDTRNGREEQVEALLLAASNELAVVSRSLTDKDRELRQSRATIDTLTKDLAAVAVNYDRATNRIAGLRTDFYEEKSRSSELNRLLSCASNNLAAVTGDLGREREALSKSVRALSVLSNDYAFVVGRYNIASREVVAISNRFVNSEERFRSAELALSMKSNELSMASVSLASMSNDYAVVSRKYERATNDLAVASERLEDAIGSGLLRRQSLIRTCKFGLFVKLHGAKRGEMFYSPMICIGTNRYVMAYMPRKNVSKIEQKHILSMECRAIGVVDSVWGLAGRDDADVLFFKLETPNRIPALSLGANEIGIHDHFYWFRSRGSDIDQAGIMSADAGSSWNDYRKIQPGDMLISERRASVVKMAISRVSALKSEIEFGVITERDLVRLDNLQ